MSASYNQPYQRPRRYSPEQLREIVENGAGSIPAAKLTAGVIEINEPIALGVIAHAMAPYPHAGGCNDCRAVKRCNHCGRKFAHVHVGGDSRPACTNGRCEACHGIKCTPGGKDAPGHGFGL